MLPVRTALRRLRDLLAELIFREDEAKRIVRDSGAPIGGAWWSSDPKSFWQDALDDAHRASRMEKLFSAIDEILDANPDWERAKLEYLRARDADNHGRLRSVRNGTTATVSLTINERRVRDLEDALARVAPTVFDDPRIAVERLGKAKTALRSIAPLVEAVSVAAARETRQPRGYELQQLEHALLERRTAVAQNLSALGKVRSAGEAKPLCDDLVEEAAMLVHACVQAIQHVI